jgi:hypothetical protein
LGRLEDGWNTRTTQVSCSLDQRAGGRTQHDEDSGHYQEGDDQADHDV